MSGTITTPAGGGGDTTGLNNEGQTGPESYTCTRCGEVIPLSSGQNIENIVQVIQEHLEECISLENTSGPSIDVSAANTINPLDLLMPLQPRRTWSAEDERRKRLEDDPDAYDVSPHSVTCGSCHRPIRLNATGKYYAANWNKHKMGCKSTGSETAAGASALEAKFNGRVAAFRVAKPASEGPVSALQLSASSSQDRPETPETRSSLDARASSSMASRSPQYDNVQQPSHPHPSTSTSIQMQVSEDYARRMAYGRGVINSGEQYPSDTGQSRQHDSQSMVEIRSSPAAPRMRVDDTPDNNPRALPSTSSHASQLKVAEGRPSSLHYASLPSASFPRTDSAINRNTLPQFVRPSPHLDSHSQRGAPQGSSSLSQRDVLVPGYSRQVDERSGSANPYLDRPTGHTTNAPHNRDRTSTFRETQGTGHLRRLEQPSELTALEKGKYPDNQSGRDIGSTRPPEVDTRRHKSGTGGDQRQMLDPRFDTYSGSVAGQPSSSRTHPPSNTFSNSADRSSSALGLTGIHSPNYRHRKSSVDEGSRHGLPSMNSLIRTLPPASMSQPRTGMRRAESTPGVGPQRTHGRRDQEFPNVMRPSRDSPPGSMHHLPSIRMLSPRSSPSSNKRRLDDEAAFAHDRPSPPKIPTPLDGSPNRSTSRLPSYFGHSAPQRTHSPPLRPSSSIVRPVRAESSSIQSTLGRAPSPLGEDVHQKKAAKLHPVWKWERADSDETRLSHREQYLEARQDPRSEMDMGDD